MKPVFKLTADTKDVTEKLANRVIEIAVTDARGLDSDTLEITLDDIGNELALPKRGAVLAFWLGFEKAGMYYHGTFTVDDVSHNGPPDRIFISAKAQDQLSKYKASKSRSFHKKILYDIVQKIADDNSLQLSIDTKLAAVKVDHVDQTQESDMHFLSRLAKQYGARVKISDGHLVFALAGAGKTASGKDLPRISIKREGSQSHSFSRQERDEFTGVEAVWHNHRMSKRKLAKTGKKGTITTTEEVTAGSADKVKRLKQTFIDEATARAAAEAEWARLQRGRELLSVEFGLGRPDIKSEFYCDVTGYPSYINGEWVVVRVRHSLTKSSGLSSSLNLERPEDYFANDGG